MQNARVLRGHLLQGMAKGLEMDRETGAAPWWSVQVDWSSKEGTLGLFGTGATYAFIWIQSMFLGYSD